MKKLRVFLACLVCRLARWGIRLLGRGGTSLPGKLALKVCPDLLSELGRGVDTLILTGTNGKTTTAGMLRHMLDAAGTDYFSNRTGANLKSGIAAEFIRNASVTGRMKKKLAVIECDEGTSPPSRRRCSPG